MSKFLNFCDFRWRRRPAMRATRSSENGGAAAGQRSQQQHQASGGGRRQAQQAAAQRQAISRTSAATLALHTAQPAQQHAILIGPCTESWARQYWLALEGSTTSNPPILSCPTLLPAGRTTAGLRYRERSLVPQQQLLACAFTLSGCPWTWLGRSSVEISTRWRHHG
jgi:hypothetical protein